jgi:hypothetical protein
MASDVKVAGWEESDIVLRLRDGRAEDLIVEQAETGPVISARQACEIKVPTATPVTVRDARSNLRVSELMDLNAEQVRGNLKLSEVDEAVIAEVYGSLKATEMSALRVVGTIFGQAVLKETRSADLQNVRGNLQVAGVGHLRASRIGGNLTAKEIEEGLSVEQVGGNALLKEVAGAVSLEQVAGNLVAKDLTGGASVPKIGGNLVWNGEVGRSRTYHFSVRGNATLRLEEDASAHVTLTAGGKLLSSLVLADQEQVEGRLTGTLGGGGAEIVVEARGNVLLGGGPGAGAPGLGEEISRQVEESLRAIDLEAIGRQVSEEMESAMSRLRVKLESVDWDRIGTQTERAVEQAMERMSREMERMTVKAARYQEKVERRAEKEGRRQEKLARKMDRAARRQRPVDVEIDVTEWPVEGAAEAVEPEPDLDEERLSILRMVEQGQITPQEAEMLLDALE